jgi:hypothetical protein
MISKTDDTSDGQGRGYVAGLIDRHVE